MLGKTPLVGGGQKGVKGGKKQDLLQIKKKYHGGYEGEKTQSKILDGRDALRGGRYRIQENR